MGRKSYIFLGLVFLVVSLFMYGVLWMGNHFYYEHGQTAPTEDDLNRLMTLDVLFVGTPLFVSGLFFGKSMHINKTKEMN